MLEDVRHFNCYDDNGDVCDDGGNYCLRMSGISIVMVMSVMMAVITA